MLEGNREAVDLTQELMPHSWLASKQVVDPLYISMRKAIQSSRSKVAELSAHFGSTDLERE